jgi:glucans biosynthesis protein C
MVLLGLGLVSPVLYFGAQLACGLMTDGYSFTREAASDLGTSDRLYHRVFNGAALATGCSLICGGIGLLLVSTRRIPRRLATIIVAVCCLSAGAAAVTAGLYPLPDVRHGGGPIGAGMFVAPFAVAFALRDRVRLRPYLGLNIAVFVVGGAILSRGSPAIAGLGQRLLAGAVFPAFASVCALWLVALATRGSQ